MRQNFERNTWAYRPYLMMPRSTLFAIYVNSLVSQNKPAKFSIRLGDFAAGTPLHVDGVVDLGYIQHTVIYIYIYLCLSYF